MEKRAKKICEDAGLSWEQLEAMIGDVLIDQGEPFEFIVAEAERVHADMIIMGSHGQSAVSKMLLGSVAHKVSMKAKAPVLLVPIGGD